MTMMLALPLDSASRLLDASNCLYVVGALLTLGSAAMVLYEKRSKSKGLDIRWGFATEVVVIVAAFISLTGTIGAICFGYVVNRLKDADLQQYKDDADKKIASAGENAAESIRKAVAAQLEIDKLKPTVSTLQSNQTETNSSVHLLETKASERHISINAKELEQFRILNDTSMIFLVEEGYQESLNLEHQLADIFIKAGLKPSSGTIVGPGPSSLLNTPGIHIEYEQTEVAKQLVNELGNLLRQNKITFDTVQVSDAEILRQKFEWPSGPNKVKISIGRKP
jgi:hypothetical protein